MSPPSDRGLYAVGIFCSLLTGVGKGMFGLLFTRSLTALGAASPDKIASDGVFWAVVFLLVGVGMHVCELVLNICLGVTGEHLTKALRHNMIGKLLTQEIGCFDQESNTMGALTEFLGEKLVLINGLVGERLGMIAQAVTMLVTVVFTMFYWGDWRVTLLVLGCLPIMGAAMAVAMAAMMPMDQGKQGKKDKDADAKKSAGAPSPPSTPRSSSTTTTARPWTRCSQGASGAPSTAASSPGSPLAPSSSSLDLRSSTASTTPRRVLPGASALIYAVPLLAGLAGLERCLSLPPPLHAR
jgi:hypothetical protein